MIGETPRQEESPFLEPPPKKDFTPESGGNPVAETEGAEFNYDVEAAKIEEEYGNRMGELGKKIVEAFPGGDYDDQLKSAKEKIDAAQNKEPIVPPSLTYEQRVALAISEKDEEIIRKKLKRLEEIRESRRKAFISSREQSEEKAGEV